MELVLYIFLAIFSVFGVLDLIRFFALAIWKFPGAEQKVVCYPLSGGGETLEMAARSLHQRETWEIQQAKAIVLVDCGLDDEGKRAAKVLCKELPGLVFCPQEEVPQLLRDLFECP
ncbi:MAG: hypothetical protein ACOX60_04365 [Massiliimalia sp.]